LTAERVDLILALIRRECEAGLSFVDGVERDEFLADTMIQHAVSMSLIAVGEYIARIAKDSPDFVAAHPAIPWTSVVGMRNRIAHGYYGLDFEVVWDTITTSIPELLAKLPAVSP
jgi:uncharacterized protein with HEPN domain